MARFLGLLAFLWVVPVQAQKAPSNPCALTAQLAQRWDRFAEDLERAQSKGMKLEDLQQLAPVERQLVAETLPTARALAKTQKAAKQLLAHLVELDRVDDNIQWDAAIIVIGRIVRTIDKLALDCTPH